MFVLQAFAFRHAVIKLSNFSTAGFVATVWPLSN